MADKILIHCPSCLARIRVSPQLLGQQRKCPGCGIPFTISLLPDDEESPAPPAAAAADAPLVSQSDTIDQRLDWGEVGPGQMTPQEELDAAGARHATCVAQFTNSVERPGNRAAS